MTDRRFAAWVVLAAAGYAAIRLWVGEEYGPAAWADLVAGTAPRPFGTRVLIPWLARPLHHAGVPIRMIWWVFEAAAAAAVVAGLHRLLARTPVDRAARGWAVVALPILLVLYPGGRWPIFYPWDTPAVAVVVWGVVAVIQRRLGLAAALVALGAANRETALIVPAAAVALGPGSSRSRTVGAAALLIAVYGAVRLGIDAATADLRGPALHFTVSQRYRALENLRWLADPGHAVTLLARLSGLPLIWLWVRWRATAGWVRMTWLLWAMTLGLWMVGNAYEFRIYGEVLALLYAAVVIALRGDPSHALRRRPIHRLVVPAMLASFLAVAWSLHAYAWLPVSQWPMPKSAAVKTR